MEEQEIVAADMSDSDIEEQEIVIDMPEDAESLKPKKALNMLCPSGVSTFTVFRRNDESGVSGTGVIIDGAVFATGQCVVHWLTLPPKGSIAIFDSMDDFIKIHIGPHPGNKTIITFEDGTQMTFPAEQPEVINGA